jgi:hypothetical protein
MPSQARILELKAIGNLSTTSDPIYVLNFGQKDIKSASFMSWNVQTNEAFA